MHLFQDWKNVHGKKAEPNWDSLHEDTNLRDKHIYIFLFTFYSIACKRNKKYQYNKSCTATLVLK